MKSTNNEDREINPDFLIPREHPTEIIGFMQSYDLPRQEIAERIRQFKAEYPFIKSSRQLYLLIGELLLWYLSTYEDRSIDTLDQVAHKADELLDLLGQNHNQGSLLLHIASRDGWNKFFLQNKTEIDKINEAIVALKVLCTDAHKSKSRLKKPKNHAMRACINTIAEYWEDEWKQPYTQDFHKISSGHYEPVTQAAKFSYSIMHFIELLAQHACGNPPHPKQFKPKKIDYPISSAVKTAMISVIGDRKKNLS